MYPPGNEHIPPNGKRKIIDSTLPTGRGYVSSQEGNVTHVHLQVCCRFCSLLCPFFQSQMGQTALNTLFVEPRRGKTSTAECHQLGMKWWIDGIMEEWKDSNENCWNPYRNAIQLIHPYKTAVMLRWLFFWNGRNSLNFIVCLMLPVHLRSLLVFSPCTQGWMLFIDATGYVCSIVLNFKWVSGKLIWVGFPQNCEKYIQKIPARWQALYIQNTEHVD